MSAPQTIKIDNVEYIRKDSVPTNEKSTDGLDYVIIRSEKAGVFAGYLVSKKGDEVVLRNSRRIWYWEGAATLSQAAVNGFSRPKQCKFPVEVPEMTVLQVIEVLPCSKKAKETIDSVPVWSA